MLIDITKFNKKAFIFILMLSVILIFVLVRQCSIPSVVNEETHKYKYKVTFVYMNGDTLIHYTDNLQWDYHSEIVHLGQYVKGYNKKYLSIVLYPVHHWYYEKL